MSAETAKPTEYYANVRRDILPLLGGPYGKALEIGCGAGGTLRHLRDTGLCAWVGGVEPTAAADEAAGHLDQTWHAPVEDLLAAGALPQADLILCLDVLEHLVNPWQVLRQLAALLPPGGTLIASIPNIRHYKVSLPLVLEGRWEYQDSGIMDSTHLRFFTRASAQALFAQAGLVVADLRGNANLKPWKNKWILNKLSGGRLEDLYTVQFLIRAQKP